MLTKRRHGAGAGLNICARWRDAEPFFFDASWIRDLAVSAVFSSGGFERAVPFKLGWEARSCDHVCVGLTPCAHVSSIFFAAELHHPPYGGGCSLVKREQAEKDISA